MSFRHEVNLHISVPFLVLVVFVTLFPILPSYTRLGGYTAYLWLAIIVFSLFFLIYNRSIIVVKKPYLLFSSAIIVLYTVPLLFNAQPERVIYELLDVWLPITVILLGLKNSNREQIEKIISVLIFVSGVLCISGLVEEFCSFNIFSLIENYAYDNPNFGSKAAIRFGMRRIEQSFNTSLTYALYLMMAFNLTFYRFFSCKKKRYLCILVLQIINVILTFTRGVSLVFFVGTALLFFSCKPEIGINRTVETLLIVLLCIVLLFSFFPDVRDSISNLLGSALNLLLGSNETTVDDSSLLRDYFQRAAFNALKSPVVFLFGVGEYGLRAMITIDNEWLLELTGYGIFGIFGFILLQFVPIFYSMKGFFVAKYYRDFKARILYKCFLAIFFEYAVSLYTVAQMAEARMYYILFGIACSYFTKIQKVKNV